MESNEIDVIHPSEIKERLQGGETMNLIDVREIEEVLQGMIPGAKHIPLGELPERHTEIERTPEIVMVCRSGRRSAAAVEFLQSLGFTGLKNMEGGMLEWNSLG